MRFTFRKGLKTNTDRLRGPVGEPSVQTVAFLGADYPGVVFDLKVAEGDPIVAGQILCFDRRRTEVAFVASAAGLVPRIRLAALRRLGCDQAVGFHFSRPRAPEDLTELILA